MEDLSLRATFHRALDPVAPPAPWLPDVVMADLRKRRVAHAAAARGRRLAWAFPSGMSRLTAAALILALIMASLVAFAALNVYLHNGVPSLFPHRVSRMCSSFDSYASPAGDRWHGGSPPKVQNWLAGDQAECIIDPLHAWTTETTGAVPCGNQAGCAGAQVDGIVVMSTGDGGKTWRQGQTLPFSGSSDLALLDFIDASRGWLLTDTRATTLPEYQRNLYATSDGGLHWKQVSGANANATSAFARTGIDCEESGLVMTPAGAGWITWGQCSPGSGPAAVSTTDGGRTWTAVSLPPLPNGSGLLSCAASPPVFSANNGAMPFACPQKITGVYRTGDGGKTWTLGTPLPFYALNGIVFGDGLTGYAVQPRRNQSNGTGNTLFETEDGGKSWKVVSDNLFPGRNIYSYSFFDTQKGYALVGTQLCCLGGGRAGVHLWLTSDGGRTWTVAPPDRSVGQTVCSTAPATPSSAADLTSPAMFGTASGWDSGPRHTTDGGSHWTTVAAPSAKLRAGGYGEFFLNATDAWVVEAAGSTSACADHVVVYRTADGGQRWQQVASVGVALKDPTQEVTPSVDFMDRQHGWIFLSTGALLKTSDAGTTWTEVSATAGSNSTGCPAGPNIYFASATNGWLQLQCSQSANPVPYRLLVTRDGGVTWAVQTITAQLFGGTSVLPVFTDPQHGALWDPAGLLAVTSDGGRSWAVRTPPISVVPCQGKGGLPGNCSDESVVAASFINGSEGWALIGKFSAPQGKGGPFYAAYRFVRTTNGGRTWSVVSRLPNMNLSDFNGSTTLQFVDASNGFWMWSDRWYRTHDGGRSWVLAFTGVPPSPSP